MSSHYQSSYNNPQTPYDQNFWDNYALFLAKQGVEKKYLSWYVLRTKQYVANYPDTSVRDHTHKQVEAYLDNFSAKHSLKRWQFIQVVDAIQTLFCLALKLPWAQDYDWDYLKGSAKTLEPDHPTIARDYSDALASLPEYEPQPYDPEAKQKYQPIIADVIKTIRTKNYSIRTEKTYVHWVFRFLVFHKPDDAMALGADEVRIYLEYLAIKRNVSVSTQKQALNALAFLFNKVWEKPLGNIGAFIGAKRPRKLPVVLSKNEVKRVLEQLGEKHQLMAGIMYGGGLRLMECVTLRIQDVDFEYNQLVIRNGKGFKDRIVPLPKRYQDRIRQQIQFVREQHAQDIENGYGARPKRPNPAQNYLKHQPSALLHNIKTSYQI